MNFFQQQEHARRRSARLVYLFALLVIAFLGFVYFLIAPCVLTFRDFVHDRMSVPEAFFMSWIGLIRAFLEPIVEPAYYWKWIWHPRLFFEICGGSLVVIACGSVYKIAQLSRGGGSVVAKLLGGRLLDQHPADPDELKLRHVVEEMAIASNMPMPEIYVLDNERGINSFAAGHSTSDVAIGVTRGCLRLLTRDELQGVVAHEFSHILNGDTRLNMRLMGLTHGMLFPSILGRKLVSYWTSENEEASSIFDRRSQNAFPLLLIGGALQVTGWFSLPFVRLLKSAICREREWLADASAVQFTRNPEGIAGALKKIGGLLVQGRLRTPHAETASHLYFANCSSDALFQWFSTHPPLVKRIAAISPYFDGQFPHVKMLPASEGEIQQRLEDSYALLAQSAATHEGMASAISNVISPEQARAIRNAAVVRKAIPEEILRIVHQPQGAMAFIYALLLDLDDSARAKQLKDLRTNTDPGIYDQTLKLQAPTALLDERSRLALIDLALPALRQLTMPQYQELMRNTEALIESDNAIILFEYTMQKVLARHLRPQFEKSLPPRLEFRTMEPLANDCAVLLSALARMEREDAGAIEQAFAAGVGQLDLRTPISLLPRDNCNLPQIDDALERAARATLYIRRNLMYACAHVAAANGQMPGREVLLLRAIADALDCPVPPFVDSANSAPDAQPQM